MLINSYCSFIILGGKREAEDAIEKLVSAKKQKGNDGVAQAVKKAKVEAKTQKKNKKDETSSSSSEEDSSDSEEEQKVCIHTYIYLFVMKIH